jgi:hypothetical protein
MSTPVTRGEMREELGLLRQDIDQQLRAVQARIEQGEQRFEQRLEIWGGALLARIEQVAQVTERRLSEDLAHHARSIHEAMQAQFAALDDKYADLPERVRRLEGAVFAPEQR